MTRPQHSAGRRQFTFPAWWDTFERIFYAAAVLGTVALAVWAITLVNRPAPIPTKTTVIITMAPAPVTPPASPPPAMKPTPTATGTKAGR